MTNYAEENEKQARFQIFKDNLEKVNHMNEGQDEILFGITQFMDLTHEEFLSSYTGLIPGASEYQDDCPYVVDADISDAPESFDWRDHNAVTSVKNQLSCQSCYAFSSIGNIESQYTIKHKQQLDLSEQQIVDCNTEFGGCVGGFMSTSFRKLIEEGGVENEADYPYVGKVGQCQIDQNKVQVKLTGCHSYNLTSQEKLKQLLYSKGPISIAIKADSIGFLQSKGIVPNSVCETGDVDHAVLLVGYGAEGGQPFWIVKNSWGDSWGDIGYFRTQRGESATSCGMMNNMMASSVL